MFKAVVFVSLCLIVTRQENSTGTTVTETESLNLTGFTIYFTNVTAMLPTTTIRVKAKKLTDAQYDRYMNVIKPTVYRMSFYCAVFFVVIGLVLNVLAAVVFIKSNMVRTPVGWYMLRFYYIFVHVLTINFT